MVVVVVMVTGQAKSELLFHLSFPKQICGFANFCAKSVTWYFLVVVIESSSSSFSLVVEETLVKKRTRLAAADGDDDDVNDAGDGNFKS